MPRKHGSTQFKNRSLINFPRRPGHEQKIRATCIPTGRKNVAKIPDAVGAEIDIKRLTTAEIVADPFHVCAKFVVRGYSRTP